LQNPRAAVNAVLGFSRWFGRVLGSAHETEKIVRLAVSLQILN
jgi:hypothetical protein